MTRAVLLSAPALGAVALACNAVLGFEEARVDPSFDPSDAGPPRLDGSADAGKPADAGGATVECASYCALMSQHCTGANTQYVNDAACRSFCSAMDLGVLGELTKDTLACRQFFAEQAGRIEPATSCRSAGPLGNGVCGASVCSAFCKLNLSLCGASVYSRTEECVSACERWPFDPRAAVQDDEDKDTLNCRNYHLQAGFAAPNQAAVHCPHTRPESVTCFAIEGDGGLL